jgi:hypothetical protein
MPVNEFIDGVTITFVGSRLVRLFKTAALACSRSGRRKTDFVWCVFLVSTVFAS